MIVSDVLSLGQDVCEGLVLTNSFYWNLTPKTRAWGEAFAARAGKPPNEYNAGCYAAVTHWLKSAQAANTVDGDEVAARMRATPINDIYNEDVRILANGSVPHAMHLWEVKARNQSNHKWDVFKRISTLPSPQAFPPPALFGCPLAGA